MQRWKPVDAICMTLRCISCKGRGSSCDAMRMQLTLMCGVLQAAAVAALRKLTKSEKEHTLKQLVADGWLRHSHTQSGHYCIGVRAALNVLGQLMPVRMTKWPAGHACELV